MPTSAAHHSFPRRHMSQPEVWLPMVNKLKPLFPLRPLPNQELSDAFGRGLLQGDTEMDALVEWMVDTGMAQTKPLFLQALEKGIHTLPDAPEPLQRFFDYIDNRPAWVDDDLLRIGSEASGMQGSALSVGLRDFILMGGYLSSSINEVLAVSGGLKNPVRRLAETAQWVVDITNPGGLERFAPGFISTIRVRWVHALVRRHIRNMPNWDQDQHGLPANQTDMAGTWLGFAIGGPVAATLLGKWVLSPRDLKGYLHMHRYAAWLMGVDEHFLTDDPVECAYRLANNTMTQPGPSAVCREMAGALADHKLYQIYDHLPAIQGRWNRHVQLSRTHFFLGAKAMRSLGLNPAHLPWQPLVTLPGVSARSFAMRFLVPGQRKRLIREGRAEQRKFLDSLYNGLDRSWQPENTSAVAAA